jgi:thiosulfate/3-mercaptopyruvate sulfurtransferase
MHRTLISVEQLMSVQRAGAPLVVLDCGFDLMKVDAGRAAYGAGHIPGAFYAHLDEDLSGVKNGRNGRHPLPAREAFAARLGAWGITPATQVVTYDNQGGTQAARAWWLLRWMGHDAVALLDGGLGAWRAAGGALEDRAPQPKPAAAYPAREGTMKVADAASAGIAAADGQLIDARALERFRGEVEPLDPVAGRIPGARHRFFKENLLADGRFKPAQALREEFARLGLSAAVHSCGSGVVACHNVLAMAHAGMGDTTLYPGSWSEWCSDPARPVERG